VSLVVCFLQVTLVAMLSGHALALTGEQYLHQAKINLTQARQMALKAYPGKIVSEELEKEPGGSGLRYSFIIVGRTKKHEVGIDAKTGAVLENSVEGESPD
jgi:uncharacterized membrane protein YkoI